MEISIGQALCPENAERLAHWLRAEVPNIASLKTRVLGTAIGVHGRPGTLIVSFRPAVSANDLAVGLD